MEHGGLESEKWKRAARRAAQADGDDRGGWARIGRVSDPGTVTHHHLGCQRGWPFACLVRRCRPGCCTGGDATLYK